MAQRTPPMEGSGRGSGSGPKSGWACRPGPNANSNPRADDRSDVGHGGGTDREVDAGDAHGDTEAAALKLAPSSRPNARDGPFVWQREQQLLLLDEELFGWTLAELRFDARLCHYVEVRRATYRWPREAAGALLCRVLSIDGADIEQAAADLNRWIAAHQAASVTADGQPAA